MRLSGYDRWLNSGNPADAPACPNCEGEIDTDGFATWCIEDQEPTPGDDPDDPPRGCGWGWEPAID